MEHTAETTSERRNENRTRGVWWFELEPFESIKMTMNVVRQSFFVEPFMWTRFTAAGSIRNMFYELEGKSESNG